MLVHHFVGGDIICDLLYHLPSLFIPPILNLPLSLPGICLHKYQVARFQIHCAYFSVILIFLLACFCGGLGLCLPKGAPQSICHRSYIHVHTPDRGLSYGGLIAAIGGEDEVNQEPRLSLKHQIMWTVPSNWRSDGIIGMCYFSQM